MLVSSSARNRPMQSSGLTIGHTFLVRGMQDAADDSGLVQIDGHLERLWSGVRREPRSHEVGTKTNVVGIVLQGAQLEPSTRACVVRRLS